MSVNGRAHVLDRDLDRYHYDEVLSAILFDTGYNRTTSYQQMCAVFNKTLATFATDSSAAAAAAPARGAHTSSRTYVTGSTLVMQIDGVSSQWTSLSNGRRWSGADAFVDTSRMFMPLLVSSTFGVGVSISTSSYNASFQGDAGEAAHSLWCCLHEVQLMLAPRAELELSTVAWFSYWELCDICTTLVCA
jgi:hypothetical protein